jgi:ferredoxin
MNAMELSLETWIRFEAECQRLGLGLTCANRVSALLPQDEAGGATHAVVVLQTGGAYWELMRTLQGCDPALRDHPDPLDTLTLRMAERLRNLLGTACTEVRFPFDESPVDFVTLGVRAGAGRPGRLSILMHPEYGPWMAFRMLFLVADPNGVLPIPEPLGEHPCDSCAAPCIAACPAGAIQGDLGKETLDYPHSFRYRIAHPTTCPDACAARIACPAGAAYRYPADFISAAQHRAFGFGKAYYAVNATAAQTAGG